MSAWVQNLNLLLSVFTILAQAAALGVLGLLITGRGRNILVLISKHAEILSFLAALAAVVLSLFYSDVVGFAPCLLCWWQRVFIYPQAVMFALAAWRRESIAPYSFLLSVIGGTIAWYHYYGQMFAPGALACGPGEISCAKLYFVTFGYVTLPLMSFTAFLVLGTIAFVRMRIRA